MASVVWVWDLQKMNLEAVLEQTSAVRCFQWDPKRPRLALCTGNTKLYLWSPAGCASVQVPTEGNVFCHQMLKPDNWGSLVVNSDSAPKAEKEKLQNLLLFFFQLCVFGCFHLYTLLSFLPARWIPGPGAKLALQRRLSDRHRQGATLFMLHGRWAARPIKCTNREVKMGWDVQSYSAAHTVENVLVELWLLTSCFI